MSFDTHIFSARQPPLTSHPPLAFFNPIQHLSLRGQFGYRSARGDLWGKQSALPPRRSARCWASRQSFFHDTDRIGFAGVDLIAANPMGCRVQALIVI